MDCDVLVAGGGSGGFAAALAAARGRLRVVLVERQDRLGGTSTVAGVSAWESGCGGTGIPFELYKRLKAIPDAVGIYGVGRHCCWPDEGAYPGGENLLRPELRYADTLVRYSLGFLTYGRREDRPLIRQRFNGVVFEPDAMAQTMTALLQETGRVRQLLSTAVVGAMGRDGRLEGVRLSDGTALTARFCVDATGDVELCEHCGGELLVGEDPRSRFGEPGAPEQPSGRVNGVTLMCRVTRAGVPGVEPLPAGVPETCWWRPQFPVAHVVPYPCGDLSLNLLPAMEGAEYLALGSAAARAECERRLAAFWHHYQRHFPEWQAYRLGWVAPVLGVRETRRTWCETMLTQHDLEAGLTGQKHPDIVALADHNYDVHGSHAAAGRGVRSAYGIPYRCLLPRGSRNLLVACRGAGFSAIAASACRLSRTMLQLGQAAGTACVLAHGAGVDLPDVPPEPLREALRAQHVCLQFPMEAEIEAWIGRE